MNVCLSERKLFLLEETAIATSLPPSLTSVNPFHLLHFVHICVLYTLLSLYIPSTHLSQSLSSERPRAEVDDGVMRAGDNGEEDYVINIVISDFAGGGASKVHDVRSILEDLVDLVREAEAALPPSSSEGANFVHLSRTIGEMRSKLQWAFGALDALAARLNDVEVDRDQLQAMADGKEEQIQEASRERRSLLDKVRILRQQLSLHSSSSERHHHHEWEKLRREDEGLTRPNRSESLVDENNTQGLLDKVYHTKRRSLEGASFQCVR